MVFVEMLTAQRKGQCVEEASTKLAQVVKACIETGKKGRLAIVFDISPAGDTVIVKDKIVPATPEKETQGTTFYADEKGMLSRENKNQKDLFETVPEQVAAAN